ncbi:MAG: TAXI family TRAP transporter solute-binding subunit [Magnetococcales bacterium]|nr:TAXI family TRAP transporter solute-binding subunit [Magnetococcales bacterium]
MSMKIRIAFGTLALILTASAWADSPRPTDPPAPPRAETRSESTRVTIASGEIGGLFYPAAGAICQELTKNRTKQGGHSLPCAVEPSLGSTSNLQALADREVAFGLADSDAIRKAWDGESPFPRAMKSLRSVITLYTEAFTLMTPVQSGIKTLEDLKGRRLVLGLSDPTLERTAREVLNACGFKPEATTFRPLGHEAIAPALKKQEIQAHLFVVGHPDERVWQLASAEPVTIIPLTGSCLEPLLAKRRHYVKSSIPGGIYPGLEQETPTLGLRATLMASADTPEELVHAVTRSIVEKLYRFRSAQPDADAPEPKSLFEGLVAPLHLGAFRYFQELRVLEFRNSGEDLLSGLPGLVEPDGNRRSIGIALRASDALKALRLPIGGAKSGDAGLPISSATSPAAAQAGSAHWLMIDSPKGPS